MNEAYGRGADSMDSDSLKTLKKYEELLENDPASPTFVFLAQILYKQNKLERAIGVLIKGLRYNTNNITGRFLLGRIYYEGWMIESAKKELETVFGLAPDNLAAGKMLVEIYKSEDNFEKALEVLRFVYEFHPSNTSIRSEIEQLLEEIDGQPPAPWENFSPPAVSKKTEAAEPDGDPLNTELITETMADIYIKQGDYGKGLSVLQNIFENDPENNSVRKKLEECRLKVINKMAGFNKEE
jgi:tetratricopeptide (TPR) repeat protein